MAKPQHRTPEYVAAYRAIKRAQAAGMDLMCVESECVFPTRVIYPNQRAAVLHDPSGAVIIGNGHYRCNAREAAIRGNRMRAQQSTRYAW